MEISNTKTLSATNLMYQYAKVHYALRKEGKKHKVIFIGLGIIAAAFAAALFALYYRRVEYFIPFFTIAFLLLGLILLTIKSTQLVSNRKLMFYRNRFKNDFAALVTSEIPEIESFRFNRRVNPLIFIQSGLFPKKYSDYQGDDYIIGHYRQMKFELSELHVLRTLTVLFSGFFAHLVFPEKIEIGEHRMKQLSPKTQGQIHHFETSHKAHIHIKPAENQLYISFEMKGEYFESIDLKSTFRLQMDLDLLKEMIEILKAITDDQT
jgi:hypothetical protein